MWTCSLLDGLIIFLENVEDGFGQHRLDRAVLLNGQDGERSGNRRIKPASDRLFTDAIALATRRFDRSEEHRLNPVTNAHLVCRLLLEKKKRKKEQTTYLQLKNDNTTHCIVRKHKTM